MKKIICAFIIIFSGICLSQTKMDLDKVWKNIFIPDNVNGTDNIINDGFSKYLQKLSAEAAENNLGKTNLKFDMELLRVKGIDKEIILKQSKYPLPNIKNNLTQLDIIKNIELDLYAGLFAMPLLLKEEKVFYSSLNSSQKESSYAYGLLIIPLKKEGQVYTLRLSLLTYLKLFGRNVIVLFRDQETTLKLGEKIRIDIDPRIINKHTNFNEESADKNKTKISGMYGMMNNISSSDYGWVVNPTINDKVITFSSDDSFFKGIKDHLILSLESD